MIFEAPGSSKVTYVVKKMEQEVDWEWSYKLRLYKDAFRLNTTCHNYVKNEVREWEPSAAYSMW